MDKNVFAVVKKHIDIMDYHALLSEGAPKNEFDSEAKEISCAINAHSSIAEIAEIIAQVFERNFGEPEKAENFLETATDIKNDLMQII